MPQGTWLIIDRFLKKCIYLLIFGCAGPSLLHRLFSSRGERRLLSSFGVWASHCGGFSCCGAWAQTPQSLVLAAGLSGSGSWALEHRLSSCSARA